MKTQMAKIIRGPLSKYNPSKHTMPPTSPRIAQELFDALLFTLFHDNVTIYPDDVYVMERNE